MSGAPIDLSLVALFQARPLLLERVTADHVDNGLGSCQCCSHGRHAVPHPCSIGQAATEARRRLRQTGDPGRLADAAETTPGTGGACSHHP